MRTLVLALGLALAAPLAAQTPAPIVSPAKWMRSLGDEFLVPGYEALGQRARGLDDALRALCAAPDAARLERARASWRDAALDWRRLAALPIGPTLKRRSVRRFDFPVRPAALEAAIEARAAGVAPERIGVAARGLPALERLLYADARLAEPQASQRCGYAAWLAADFRGEAEALAREWREWRAQWGEAADADAAGAAMTDAVNALIGTLEQLHRRSRDGLARAELLASLDGVAQTLAGANRVLRGRGHLALADRLGALTARARAAADDPEQARAALGELHAVLSGELAKALDVRIGFNETDGD